MSMLDSRLHACRPDLADERLRGRAEAARFSAGCLMQMTAPLTGVYKSPRPDAMQLTQALKIGRAHV